MTVSEIRTEPRIEREKSIDFSRLDLWHFTQAKKSLKGDFDEDRTDAFENNLKIVIDDEVFDLHLFNLNTEINGKIIEDSYNFSVRRGRDILLDGRIGITNKNGKYSATLNIKRNPSERWRDIMSGKGMELYKKLLLFLQNYTDDINCDVHHIAMKVSSLSDEDWHRKFDPIFENTPGYDKIENDKLYRWEKTYHPSRSN